MDAMFRKDEEEVERYWEQLNEVTVESSVREDNRHRSQLLVPCQHGFHYVPELFKVSDFQFRPPG